MPRVTDTGFAEFTSGLLGGVLDAIVGAQFEQARKRAAWQRAAALDDDAFAQACVDDAAVQQALAALPAGSEVDAAALRLALAREQRGLLQAVLARGLPQVVVDHGRVSARLMFSLDQPQGAANPALPGARPVPRLVATPVHTRQPEFLRLSTQVTSEVEISFKTVSD